MPSSLARVQRERDGRPVLSKETVQLPELSPEQMLVKLEYVAQNPTDGSSALISKALIGAECSSPIFR